jgi:hypothetical protein
VKISPSGEFPPPPVAHSPCAIDEEHLTIFGGAGVGGELVSDDLYILEVSLNKTNCTWYKILTEGLGLNPQSPFIFFNNNKIIFT